MTSNIKNSLWLKSRRQILHLLNLKFAWNHELLLIEIDRRPYLVPKAVLLMYHNKTCDLISVLLLSLCSERRQYRMGCTETALELVKELCILQCRYKGKYFDIVKTLEAFGVAETLIEKEGWRNEEFLTAITDDLYDSTGYEYNGSELQAILRKVDAPFRHELMCLSKITGHPHVDMAKGSKELWRKTNEIYDINLSLVLKCTNYIKRSYIKNHINKFSSWPPTELNSHLAPKALVQAYVRGMDPECGYIVEKYGQISVSDYVFIDLKKNMRFEKLDPIIPYLKDKTVSMLKSKAVSMYLSNRSDTSEKIQSSWSETRLLLAYLCNPTMVHDHVNFMDRYTESEDLEELLNYLVIRIVPKEGELKTVFRGFGAKTYESRAMSLAQEKNVMRFLQDFSNEDCMTLGELEIFRRLDGFRTLQKSYAGHKILHLVVDSSAWNNHFRAETVDIPMADTLDKIFGAPVFSKTHKAFQKTLVYVPDKSGTWSWQGQEGGIEGLNQDTWVVVYIGQIKTALEKFPYPYHVFCKGDDVRISFAIPERVLEGTSMGKLKNQIITEIATTLSSFGHKINIQESYGSSVYYAFSKYASLERVELPQSFRKIQKVHGANNAFLPTLDDYIASTFSNAHSACKTSASILGVMLQHASGLYGIY